MTAKPPPSDAGAPYRRRSSADPTDEKRVRVIVPDQPPRLTPAAARALLRILIKARDRVQADDEEQEDRQ